MKKKLFLTVNVLVVATMLLSACGPTPEPVVEVVTQIVPQTVKETVIVEGTPQVVEKEVTTVVEKVVTEEVERIVEVEKPIESQLPVDVPRDEVFVADQIFRYNVAGNYNLYVIGALTPHRHGLMMETLWYRDQETGERLYGAAISDPVYNDDFTQLTVDLRDNIYWSDGVQFTADDFVYTIETIKGNSQLAWNADLVQWVDSVEKLGDFSVRLNLTKSNPRFHVLFEAAWAGVYMMPKHALEGVEDLATFTFEDPVVLGTYLPIQFDPNGFWELFERRDDWEQTPAGIVVGKPGPKYVLTLFYGDSTRKAIAMARHELDTFFDADIEAFKSVIDTTPTFRSWYTEFPWAYPNEVAARHLSFNLDDPIFKNKDVRWALTLALDVVDMEENYIGGVAKITAIPVAPTAPLMALYHDPLEEWLVNLEIEIEPGTMYKPYDPTVPDQIAAWAEEQGYEVPGEPREVFGTGWWKYAPDVAERLLIKNGFSRNADDKWLTPEGELWTIDLQSPPDENDAFRMANAAADQWSKFGINVELLGAERSVWDQNRYVGQYGISTFWYSIAAADGDAWAVIRDMHPDYYVPIGTNVMTKGGNWFASTRVNDPKLGEWIDEMAELNPNSDENYQLVRDLIKYWVENRYDITQIGFKKFVTWDEQYWTGFPTSENPTYQPLYWFHGGKFTFESLEPVQ